MVNKDFREAGTVRDHYGDDLAVSVSPDGDVLLVITMNDDDEPRSLSVVFAPAARDELRGLLDRAAMPGQTGTGPVACRRACCDHCNNGEGDPAGHDYTLNGPHDGPCEECAAGKARREHDEGTG